MFKLVGRPVRKTTVSILREATQTPGYVKELKLVWFGEFKIQFGSCILAYLAACLASHFCDISMIRCGYWRMGRGCLLPVM